MQLEETDLKNAVNNELLRYTVLTLSVSDATGAHAVSLMYAQQAMNLYWLSDPNTRHSKTLALNPLAAVTIAGQSEDFRTIKGLQITGRARRLTNAKEENAAFKLLVARYPFLKQFAVGELARHLGAAAVYRFRPERVTLIDNTRAFGFKQTLELVGRRTKTGTSTGKENTTTFSQEIFHEW